MDLLSDELLANWTSSVRSIRSEMSDAERAHFLQARRALIKAMQDAGVGLLLGSDAPQIMNVPGYSVHQELQYLVDSGLTTLQALQSGTVNVAQFFGEEDRGALAAGNVADFLLLRDNPLVDIAHTQDIMGVARSGQWHDRDTLTRWIEDVRSRGL
jgi:imidazolonepropionase-like amidohydrolase